MRMPNVKLKLIAIVRCLHDCRLRSLRHRLWRVHRADADRSAVLPISGQLRPRPRLLGPLVSKIKNSKAL